MKGILLTVILLCFPGKFLLSQDKIISAETLGIDLARADSSTVNRLNNYAEKIQFSDPVTAIKIINTSIETARKANYPLGLSVAFSLRAGLFFYEMKLDSCIYLLDNAYALVINKSDASYRNQVANLMNRYGAIEQRRQNFDLAVDRYQQAGKIFKETGEQNKIIFSYYNLSSIYKFLGDTVKMFQYANEVNRLAGISKDPLSVIRGLIALGDAYCVVKNYDSALIISTKGLGMAQQQQLTFAIGIFNNFIGLYYTNRAQQYDTALAHYCRALASFQEINVQYDIALVYQNIGNTYLQKGMFDSAVIYSSKALKLAEELKLDQVMYFSLRDLVRAEELRGNIKESYAYLRNYVDISDSIQNKNNQRKVYQLENRYQEEQKQMMLFASQKVIERKNLINYLLGSGVLSLVLLSALFYRNYRHKQKLQLQKIKDLENEKKLTATEAVLKGEEEERTRIARDLHDGLGGILSGIKYAFIKMRSNLQMNYESETSFEHNIDMIDSSIAEMRRVAHNLMPETLVKYGLDTALKDLCIELNRSGALQVSYQSIGLEHIIVNETTAITLYRIIQELLNNTIKHANAKSALVQLVHNNGHLAVTVEDNGNGFDKNNIVLSHGIGWSNIKNRVEFLKAELDVQSEPGKGTSVHIHMEI